MLDQDSIDLKLILALTNAYEELYKKGEITEEQFHGVLSLMDHYQDYSPEDFEERLKGMFN